MLNLFSFLFYLSIPALYDYEILRKQLKIEISNEFDLNIDVSKNLNVDGLITGVEGTTFVEYRNFSTDISGGIGPTWYCIATTVDTNTSGGADNARGLFIIDPHGIIMHATINNLPVGRNVDETLRVLQAFQYVQSNPDEVCPANWTPGEKTMKPDPKGSQEYFSTLN